MLGPLANKDQFNRVVGYLEQGMLDAERVTGGGRHGTTGLFIEPTIFLIDSNSNDSKIYREEIFGPVLTIRTFKTEEEAVALANDTSYGLSACVYTSDIARALRVASKLEAGTVAINSGFVPDLNTPFGGSKESGLGREAGKAGLMAYLEPKTIKINMNLMPKKT